MPVKAFSTLLQQPVVMYDQKNVKSFVDCMLVYNCKSIFSVSDIIICWKRVSFYAFINYVKINS